MAAEEIPPPAYDSSNDLGRVYNQGRHNTCWAIVASEASDILSSTNLMLGSRFEHSPQEIVNFLSLRGDIIEGYQPHRALEFITSHGVPSIGRCSYEGLLHKTNEAVYHRCKVCNFPLKGFKNYNCNSPEWSQENFWNKDVLNILCWQPVIMAFFVGQKFAEWQMKNDAIYDPFEDEPKYRTTIKREGEDGGEEYIIDECPNDPVATVEVSNSKAKNRCLTCDECRLSRNGTYCPEHYWNASNRIRGHSMIVTGYNTRSRPFWRCKNSFGEEWADGGYCRVSRKAVYGLYVPESK